MDNPLSSPEALTRKRWRKVVHRVSLPHYDHCSIGHTKNAYETIAKLAGAPTPLQAMDTLLREQTASALDETWDEMTKPEPLD